MSFVQLLQKMISIHAPRTGSDQVGNRLPKTWDNFNPRSPHGERLNIYDIICKDFQFQSTLPARGATFGCACTNWV